MGKITSTIEAQGKVGNVVGMKGKDGRVYLRKHQYSPRNARTAGQMNRRVAWDNLVALWKTLSGKGVCAFENKRSNQTDFNAFMSANADVNPVYLTRKEARMGVCIVSPAIITLGSLPTIAVTGAAGAAKRTDIVLPNGFIVNRSTTVKVFSETIIDNNNGRFKEGDQLACLVFKQNTTDASRPVVEFEAYRITLDTTENGVRVSDKVDVDYFSANSERLGAAAAVEGGIVWIHSRVIDGKTLVSSQQIMVDNATLATYQTALKRAQAVLSYGGVRDRFLTPESILAESEPDPGPEPPTPTTDVTLTLTASPSGSCAFTVNDSAYAGPVTVASGTTVTLVATANSGYTFDRWSDNVRESEREITLVEDTALTASFSED